MKLHRLLRSPVSTGKDEASRAEATRDTGTRRRPRHTNERRKDRTVEPTRLYTIRCSSRDFEATNTLPLKTRSIAPRTLEAAISVDLDSEASAILRDQPGR